MAKLTITIGFKLEDGANGLKSLTINANDLRKVLGQPRRKRKKLNKSIINYTALSAGQPQRVWVMRSLRLPRLFRTYMVKWPMQQIATRVLSYSALLG